MKHDASRIKNKPAWVVFRLRANFWWLWLARPDMREDLRSELDLARLLAEMYPDPIMAYNEVKRRIYALAIQEGYHWTGSKWDGCKRGKLSPREHRFVYGRAA